MSNWEQELLLIKEILDSTQLEVKTKWGSDVYTFMGKNIVSYGAFKHYFALWFFNGVFLSDPFKVLLNAQEGKTKSLRQWRMTKLEEIDASKILQYVEEAITIEKQGLYIPKLSQSLTTIPEILIVQFNQDIQLKNNFEALTRGRQKEFIEYLNEVKLDTTKEKRLQKIIPLIRSAIGLHDKYRK